MVSVVIKSLYHRAISQSLVYWGHVSTFVSLVLLSSSMLVAIGGPKRTSWSAPTSERPYFWRARPFHPPSTEEQIHHKTIMFDVQFHHVPYLHISRVRALWTAHDLYIRRAMALVYSSTVISAIMPLQVRYTHISQKSPIFDRATHHVPNVPIDRIVAQWIAQ